MKKLKTAALALALLCSSTGQLFGATPKQTRAETEQTEEQQPEQTTDNRVATVLTAAGIFVGVALVGGVLVAGFRKFKYGYVFSDPNKTTP